VTEWKNPNGRVQLDVSSWQAFVLCHALQTHDTQSAKGLLADIKDQVAKLGAGYEDLKELVKEL
jgi:hypothetical protein